MKWIKEIVEKHVNDEGVLDLEAAESELNAEANKHVIPKKQYNDKVEELNDTKETLSEIQEANKDNEDLQSKVADLETKLAEKEQEASDQANAFTLKEAWIDAGGEDLVYLTDKSMDEAEFDDDGNLTNFEDIAKDYQTKHPKLFAQVDDTKEDKNGFRVLGNDLDEGQPTPPMTKEEIHKKYPGHQNKKKRMELIRETEKGK